MTIKSLFSPLGHPWLQHTSQNVYQTSASEWLRITWSSTLTRQSSSSCQGNTVLTWTCRSLLKALQCLLPQPQGTSALSWTINSSANITAVHIRSLQQPQDTSLPHKRSSTALGPSTHHFPPWLLQLAPGWTFCLRNQISAAYLATCLVFNLPKFYHVTPLFRDLHWLSLVACSRFKTMILAYKAVQQNAKVAQLSQNSSLFWHCSSGTSSLLLSGQQSRSPASARDSRLICSEFIWTLLSLPPLPRNRLHPPPPTKKHPKPLMHFVYIHIVYSYITLRTVR